MKQSRMKRRLMSVLYVLITAIVVIGMPIVLISIAGWPLPTSIPNVSNVSTAIQQGNIPAEVIIKALACVLWLVWAQLVWSLVWEVIYVGPQLAKGMKAKSAPLSTSPMQRLAARLVGGIMSVGLIATSFASASDLPTDIVPIEAVEPDGFESSALDEAGAGEDVAASSKVWRVMPGDSLWSISNGDEGVMNQIFEANASVNTALDVEPGMDLLVPNELDVPDDRLVEHVGEAEVVVEDGDHLWGIAEGRLEQALPEDPTNAEILDYVEEVVEANPVVAPNPDLIFPDDRYMFPDVGAPAPVPAPKVANSVNGESLDEESGMTGIEGASLQEQGADADQGIVSSLSSLLTSPRGVILGAGLFGLFLSLQQRQLVRGATHPLRRRRGPGDPDDLIRASKLPMVEWAGKELSKVISELENQAGGSGRPNLVEVRIGNGIEVLWQTPQVTAIKHWEVSDEGRRWRLPYRANARVLRGAMPPAFPALVTLGSRTLQTDAVERRFRSKDAEDYEQSVLVNLADYGSMSLVGSQEHTADAARSLVLELGSSETLANAKVLLVDLEIEGTEEMSRVKQGDIGEAVALLRGKAITAQGLQTKEAAVVFVNGDSAHVQTLLQETAPGSSTAVVVVGAAQNTSRHFVIQPNGTDAFFLDNQADVIRPVAVTEKQASEIASTFKGLADELDSKDWYVDIDDGSAQAKATSLVLAFGSAQKTAATADSQPLILKVFGTPKIPGLEASEAALASVSFVLAEPTRTAKDSDVIEAIWGSGSISTEDFWSEIEGLRRTLSSDAILRTSDDELTVSPSVWTDLEIFASYVSQSSGLEPVRELAQLLEALKLVEGVPFSGSPLCHWAYRPDSPVALQAIELIEATAMRAAEIGIEQKEYILADQALSYGLSGTGPNEPLLRMQMKIEAARGNIDGIEAIFHDFSTTLSKSEWRQTVTPSAETANLRNQLTASLK